MYVFLLWLIYHLEDLSVLLVFSGIDFLSSRVRYNRQTNFSINATI